VVVVNAGTTAQLANAFMHRIYHDVGAFVVRFFSPLAM
jgi:hypothetical protein